MEESLAALLEKAASGIDDGVSFLHAELPDVAQQLLLWRMVESVLLMVFGILLLSAIAYAACKIRKPGAFVSETNTNGLGRNPVMRANYEPTVMFDASGTITPWAAFICITGTVIFIFALFCLNLEWLQIWLAPKVYLIEYAADLVK